MQTGNGFGQLDRWNDRTSRSVLEKRTSFMNAKHLATYMKDHFAGSVAAVELPDF